MQAYKSNGPNGLNFIDLFCGCGGLSLGFSRAGFEVVAGIDHNEPALETYRKNVGFAANWDLSSDAWIEKIRKSLSSRSLDVLVGGPPCQGFSLTGTRRFDDERNALYNSVFHGVEAFQPKVVLIENVRGMATLYGGQARKEIERKFEDLGYEVQTKILDSANFGVPQHRLRLFFVATRSGYNFEWPEPTHVDESFVSCEDAIGDLPSMEGVNEDTANYLFSASNEYQTLMRENSKRVQNHRPTVHKQFVIETIRQVPEGGNHKDLPPGVGESRKFNEAWTRYHSKRPSRTIDTGHRNHFHYNYDRVPTIRENARLQSFPDDFVFCGSKTEQNRQVGNAVPVFLAQAIAMQICKAIT